MVDYTISIPSYKRENTLKEKTLKVLEKYDIPPEKVEIFVANEEEYDKYKRALTDSPYRNLNIGVPGIGAVRNHIAQHFEDEAKIVHLDDDLMEILHRVDEKTLRPVPNLVKDVFQRGFDYCEEHGSYIWGIYAASNPYFMKKDKSVGLYYIIGSCWGNINRRDENLILQLDDKEDYERSLQYYDKDGVVVRLDNITVKSNYYTEAGGMQIERTSERIETSAKNLAERYPELCKMYFRKTTGHAELRLRDTRPKKVEVAEDNVENFF